MVKIEIEMVEVEPESLGSHETEEIETEETGTGETGTEETGTEIVTGIGTVIVKEEIEIAMVKIEIEMVEVEPESLGSHETEARIETVPKTVKRKRKTRRIKNAKRTE